MPKSVAVIGAGVIGLLSAWEIQKNLSKNGLAKNVTIYAENFSPDTTGDISAGLWTPYILQDTPMQDVLKWSKETHEYAKKLWQEGKSHKAGISLLPMIMLTENVDEKIPAWVCNTLGYQILTNETLAQINKKTKRRYVKGCCYVSFIIEPTKLLPLIQEEFLASGGKIIKRKISSIEELVNDYDIIINCAGLNGGKLNKEDTIEVVPIRGQVLRVEAPWQFHAILDDEHYIIPNTNCVVLGGTHQEHDWDVKVREEDANYIVKGCCELVPALKNANVLKHQAGLRPGRKSVLLESTKVIVKERCNDAEKTVLVIHNYGHGGSGVTLSKGCALQVRKLVQEEVNGGNIKHKL